MFPEFRSASEQDSEDAVLGTVSATNYGDQVWIDDRHWGFLLADTVIIYGRWRARGDLWAFAPEKPSHVALILSRPQWQVLEGYWGERAEVVLDETRKWQRKRFGSVEAAPGYEDHEHCAIDWEVLGPDGQAEGYFNAPYTWVCEHCYSEYVLPRSLAFIPPPSTRTSRTRQSVAMLLGRAARRLRERR